MRLSDRLLVQPLEEEGYVIIDDIGNEIDLAVEDFARLWIGSLYFIQAMPNLRAHIIEQLQALQTETQDVIKEALIGVLGSMSNEVRPR